MALFFCFVFEIYITCLILLIFFIFERVFFQIETSKNKNNIPQNQEKIRKEKEEELYES